MPEPAASGPDAVLGLLRLGGVAVALPLQVLREVVPCPPTLAGLPAAVDGLLGAVVVRGAVLPVLDLRPAMGLPGGRHEHQVVVVLADGGRTVGLLADEVRGVGSVPAAGHFAVDAASTNLLFSHTVVHPEDGSVVSVLDAGALLSRPGLPTTDDVGRGQARTPTAGPAGVTGAPGPTADHAGPRAAGRTHALLRCGPRLLALDVRHVHTTVPGRRPRPSVVDGELCRGTTTFDGAEVAVVDPLALLGLGRLPSGPSAPAPGAGLVLDLGVGRVVLALDELLDLHMLHPEQVLPVPAAAVERADLVAGLAETPVGPVLVLDGDALRHEADLLSLARANTRTDLDGGGRDRAREPHHDRGTHHDRDLDRDLDRGPGGEPGGEPGHLHGEPFLTYRAGVDLATPLAQVAEIVPLPAAVVPAEGSGAVLGVWAYRDEAVPLVSLATMLETSDRTPDQGSCVLLVGLPGAAPTRHVGFVVDGLQAITPLSWHEPTPGDPSTAAPSLQDRPLVRLGEDGTLVPSVDLVVLAVRLLGPPADPAPADLEPTDPGPDPRVPPPRPAPDGRAAATPVG